jgi:hypothetical protein
MTGGMGSNPYEIAGMVGGQAILNSEGENPDKSTRALGTAATRAGQFAQYGGAAAAAGAVGGAFEGYYDAKAEEQKMAFNKKLDRNAKAEYRNQLGEMALQSTPTEGIQGTQMYATAKGGKLQGTLAETFAKGGDLKPLANGIVEVKGDKPSKEDGVTVDSLNAMVDHNEVMTEEPDGGVFVISDKLGYADKAKQLAKRMGELEKSKSPNAKQEYAKVSKELDNLKIHQEMSKNKEKAAKGGYLYTKMQDGGDVKKGFPKKLTEEELEALAHQKRGTSVNDNKYQHDYSLWASQNTNELSEGQNAQLKAYMEKSSMLDKVYQSMPNLLGSEGASALPENSSLKTQLTQDKIRKYHNQFPEDKDLGYKNGGKLYKKFHIGGLTPGQDLQPGSAMGGGDALGMGDYSPDAGPAAKGGGFNMPNMGMQGAPSAAQGVGVAMEMISNIQEDRAYTNKDAQARRQKYGIDEKAFGSLNYGKGVTLARAEGGRLNYTLGGKTPSPFGAEGYDSKGFTQEDYDRLMINAGHKGKDYDVDKWNKANPGYKDWINNNQEFKDNFGGKNRYSTIDSPGVAYFRDKYLQEDMDEVTPRPINIPEFESKRKLSGPVDVKEVPTYYEPQETPQPNDTNLWRFANEPTNFASLREMNKAQYPEREMNPFRKSEEVDYRAQRKNLRDTSAMQRAGTENISNTALRTATQGAMRVQEAMGVNQSLGLQENTNVGIRNADLAFNTQVDAGNRGIDFTNRQNKFQKEQDYLTERSKVMANMTDDIGMTIADADSRGIQRDQQIMALASDDPRKLEYLRRNPDARRVLRQRGISQAAKGGKLYKRMAY